MDLREKCRKYRLAFLCRYNIKKAVEIVWNGNYKEPIHWEKPVTINEKLQTLKVGEYYNNAVVTRACDKVTVKSYIEEKNVNCLCANIYAVYAHAKDIDWESLPKQFVIKCNHGCGYNIICENKDILDKKEVRKRLERWMKEEYWTKYAEPQYKYIKKRILIEEYLGDSIHTYKFYCFHGEPKVMYISSNGENGEYDKYYFPGFTLCENIKRVTGRFFPQRYSGIDVSADSERFLLTFDKQLSEEQCRQIFPEYQNEEMLEERRELVKSLSGTAFDRARKFFFKGELITLCEKQNKTCMANSVENRVPFLDNEFVKYMFEIPESELMHHTYLRMIMSGNIDFSMSYEGKYILKSLSARTFGKDFAFRKKMALRVPLSKYLRNEKMNEYINDQILPGMKQRGMINTGYFQKCYSRLDEGENQMVVWKAINAELWCQLFVDGRRVIG